MLVVLFVIGGKVKRVNRGPVERTSSVVVVPSEPMRESCITPTRYMYLLSLGSILQNICKTPTLPKLPTLFAAVASPRLLPTLKTRLSKVSTEVPSTEPSHT